MNTTPPTQPATAPGAVSGPNKASLVIGALGLVAIGALGAMLLLGHRAPPAGPTPLVEAASAPAVLAAAPAPAAAAVPDAPASAAAVVLASVPPPAAPAAHKPGPPGKSQPVAHQAAPQAPAQPAAAEAPPAVVAAAEPPPPPPPPPPPAKAVCTSCGVVASVTPIERKGEGSGLGVVAGGVLGGIVGHQAGGGRGKDALTILGAIGGGLAGNEVEKRQRAVTEYQLHIRMDDGSTHTFTKAQAMPVGQRVLVEGGQLAIDTAPAGSR